MAVRRVCDRCGKEIGFTPIKRGLTRWGLIDKRYDLCNECFDELLKWLKSDKEKSIWDPVEGEKDDDPPGDLLGIKPGPNHTGRIKPKCCDVKVVEGNTYYEPKTENEENETGVGVV